MVDFRRWILVLVALALCAGIANAAAMTCTPSALIPNLRAQGYTELVGEVQIACTAGETGTGVIPALSVGQPIPTGTVIVTLSTNVTSKLLDTTTGATEALLLIDEPGSGQTPAVANYGPQAPLSICTYSATVPCATQYIGGLTAGGLTYYVPASSAANALAPPAAGPGTNNAFQGVKTAPNQITFYNVPILPPGTNTNSRVYRIVNVRANAVGVSAGQFGVSLVSESIFTSGVLPLPAVQAQTVGIVQNGFGTKTTAATGSFASCSGQKVSAAAVGTIDFQEGFQTAFKTRQVPLTNNPGAGQTANNAAVGAQNIPNAAYGNFLFNSESGFVTAVGTATAGLADFGTRLKATFSNIPSGVTIYVAPSNNLGFVSGGGIAGGNAAASYAVLVPSDTAPEGSGSGVGNVCAGAATCATPTAVALVPVNGVASATWEVLNSQPLAQETFSFSYYVSAAAGAAPAPATISVAQAFAPNDNATTGSYTSAVSAVSQGATVAIPRFNDSSTASSAVTTSLCKTALLWPYVVFVPGTFDTGLAISNTSNDAGAIGTTASSVTAQTGSCTLNFYGSDATGAAAQTVTAYTFKDADGTTVATFDTSKGLGTRAINAGAIVPASGFIGYVIGSCNFQYAHGYAAITDVGATKLLSSYLALVMSPNNAKARGGDAEAYGN